MNILWPLVTAFLLYSTSVSCISMDLKRKYQIFQECYVREKGISYSEMNSVFINGQTGTPLASSVENLIGLIEKLENSTRYTDRPNQAKDLAAAILRKFRSDGNVVRSYSRLEQDEIHFRLDQIENALLDDTQGIEFDEKKDLTVNERCSLYFMLSYHINQTEKSEGRSGSRSSNVMRAPPSSVRQVTGQPRYGNQGINFAPVALTSRPREYGVGSFRSNGNSDQAIALNRLLLGVIAGQLKSPEIPVRDVLYKIHPEYSAEEIKVKQDGLIDPLIAVTLGNIHAMAAHAYDEPENIGVTGSWDSPMCTLEYTLRSAKPSDATLANIRGGLDGYQIGEMVRKLGAIAGGPRLRLSQILRFYYDNVGARSFGNGYCLRQMANIDTRAIRETATNYLRVLEAAKDYMVEEIEIGRSIERLGPSMDSAYGRAKAIAAEDGEWCSTGDSSGSEEACETPTDLIVALDLMDEFKDKFKNLTARLAENLNFGTYGSSMTVLSLNRENDVGQDGQIFKNNLKHIAWASSNKACPGCALQYLREDFGNMVNAPSTDLYLRINDTLRDFEMTKQSQAGVPAKPFLLMGGKYQSRTVDENIRMARYNLKTNHRDVPILLLTNSNPEDLSEYVQNPQDIIRDQESLETTAKVLATRICEVPATFQYPECIRASTETNNYYEGLITPGRKQFWAMYPEYFLKSYTINMKFTSTEGRLRVCFSRSPKPEETGRCLDNEKDPEYIQFSVTDPCKDRDARTCEPFYFQITAVDQQMNSNNICSDKRCLNTKQIKFKFAHQGMQCSGAMSKFSSISFYFMSILILFSVYTRNFKQF